MVLKWYNLIIYYKNKNNTKQIEELCIDNEGRTRGGSISII